LGRAFLPEKNHEALAEALEVDMPVVLRVRIKDDVSKHLQHQYSAKRLNF
jgi:hypothetical protein